MIDCQAESARGDRAQGALYEGYDDSVRGGDGPKRHKSWCRGRESNPYTLAGASVACHTYLDL